MISLLYHDATEVDNYLSPPAVKKCIWQTLSIFFLPRMTGVDRINGMMRTGAPAIAAADAFRAVRCLPDGNIQLAGVLTSATLGTFFRVDAETIQCDRVKEAVDRAERTQIAAERTVHHDAQHQQHDQDGYFQVNSQPSAARSGGLDAISGMPAKSVPDGQMYLQNHGWPCPTISNTVSGKTMTKPTKMTYFRYLSTRSPGRRRSFLGKGILCSRSCTSPNGHSSRRPVCQTARRTATENRSHKR